MTPSGVEVMKGNGHTVLVETLAGAGSSFDDEAYVAAGAEIIATPKEIYAKSDMVMHVKEPQPSEYDWVREGQIVFTYFHFAPDERLTRAFIKTKSIDIAYETVEAPDGSLPLLIPMSEVRDVCLSRKQQNIVKRPFGGRGVLLGGVNRNYASHSGSNWRRCRRKKRGSYGLWSWGQGICA